MDPIQAATGELENKVIAETLLFRVKNENKILRLKKAFTRKEMLGLGVAPTAKHPVAMVYQQYVGKLATNAKWQTYLEKLIETGEYPSDEVVEGLSVTPVLDTPEPGV